MSIRTILAIVTIAAISLTTMGSIGIVIPTAIAQNTTDTSNMTTFEENMTAAGNTTGGNWTK
jgi:hypothetical protein